MSNFISRTGYRLASLVSQVNRTSQLSLAVWTQSLMYLSGIVCLTTQPTSINQHIHYCCLGFLYPYTIHHKEGRTLRYIQPYDSLLLPHRLVQGQVKCFQTTYNSIGPSPMEVIQAAVHALATRGHHLNYLIMNFGEEVASICILVCVHWY